MICAAIVPDIKTVTDLKKSDLKAFNSKEETFDEPYQTDLHTLKSAAGKVTSIKYHLA
jgi:hypothetical protein